jgi:hypothetical protein
VEGRASRAASRGGVIVVAPLSGLTSEELPIPLAPGIETDRREKHPIDAGYWGRDHLSVGSSPSRPP